MASNPGEPYLSRTTEIRAPSPAPLQPGRQPTLVVLRGIDLGRRYQLGEPSILLGRSRLRCQLVIEGDPQVSAVHCRLEQLAGAGGFRVVDLDSTNGLFVGGRRVDSRELGEGDLVQVGETILRYACHDTLDEEFHRAVQERMNVDELTGLPVQRAFRHRAEALLQAARGGAGTFCCAMLDLDGLKAINDRHGHLTGGGVIAEVGRRLARIVEPRGGVASRFGGDEFSVASLCEGREDAAALAEALRAAVSRTPFVVGEVQVAATISVGFALSCQGADSLHGLMATADEALYRAKAAGRDAVRE